MSIIKRKSHGLPGI